MDIKRILAFVLLGAACIVFGFLSSMLYVYNAEFYDDLPPHWSGPSFTGTVESVTAASGLSTIVVVSESGEKRNLETQSKTIYILHEPAKGIEKGNLVKVNFRFVKPDKYFAKAVRQLKQPAPTATPPATETKAPATETKAPATETKAPAEETKAPAGTP